MQSHVYYILEEQIFTGDMPVFTFVHFSIIQIHFYIDQKEKFWICFRMISILGLVLTRLEDSNIIFFKLKFIFSRRETLLEP